MINKAIIFSLIFIILGMLSSISMGDSIQTWYAHLNKPPLTPPNWIFGPVWTFLYITMGVAIALVTTSNSNHKKVAIAIFYAHLFLNLIWSYLFFGLQSPLLGLINIILLDLSIVVVLAYFYKINKKAFFILIPYLLWLDFATYLNIMIYVLN